MFHETSLKTRYYESDIMGHINNTSYIGYLEVARADFFHDTGITRDGEPVKFVVASVRCDYLRPLYPRQTVRIRSWVTRIGNKSFTMKHEMLTEDGTVAARAETVMVRYDKDSQTSLPLEPEIASRLRPYLKRDEAET
ncbi:MAG TPA: thioesterase family protein [Paenibacillaceae bacterium]